MEFIILVSIVTFAAGLWIGRWSKKTRSKSPKVINNVIQLRSKS